MKILGVVAAIALLGTLAWGALGTGAWFTSFGSATSPVKAGTLILEVGQVTTEGVAVNNLAPGGAPLVMSLDVKNAGSLPGFVWLRSDFSENDRSDAPGDTASGTQVAAKLNVTELTMDDVSPSVVPSTFLDMVNDASCIAIDGYSGTFCPWGEIDAGETRTFTLGLQLDWSADNSFQGQGIDANVYFLLVQDEVFQDKLMVKYEQGSSPFSPFP